ncbi:MAG: amidase [Bdellovibrionaceae bacterium]|nr:amidase [Pseudobdellovibrionaceae bacterium]
MNELLKLSAQEIAERVRSGAITAVESVQTHIVRAQAMNGAINAIVAERYDRALEEARLLDQRLAKDPDARHLKFLGVPFTVKETIDLEGAPNTQGSLLRKGSIATEDATSVSRMRAAGAIPIGTTNISEWAMWFECDNLIYGATRNPYDPTRTAGGSSGGEGAIIGAGASPMGLGSDVGGSIRMPASFCGVFGHKPTNRVVPLTGHFPLYRSTRERYQGAAYPFTTQGPLTRRAVDLWPVLETIWGEDGLDRETGKTGYIERLRRNAASGFDRPGEFWKNKKVFLMPSPSMKWIPGTDSDVTQAVKLAAETFADLGARIDEFKSDALRDAFDVWAALMKTVDGFDLPIILGGGERAPNVPRELLARARGHANYTMPSLFICAADLIAPRGSRARRLVAEGHRLLLELETTLGEDGILLLPPHPRPAPKLGSTLLRPLDFAMTAIFNVLETPVTVAPMHFNIHGLPLGVQIVGARGCDHLTIGAAIALEKAGRTWHPPKGAVPS